MKMFWRLLVLELKVYFRTPVAVVWTFLFPVVLLSVLLISFERQAIGRLSIDLVDEDGTAASAALLRAVNVALKQDHRLNVTPGNSERNPIPGPRAQLRIVVSRGFEAGMAGGRPPAVAVVYFEDDMFVGRVGKSIAELAIVEFVRQSLQGASPVSLAFTEHIVGHGPTSYPTFLLPGCFVLMLYASCLFRFAVPLAGLRRNGFMKTFAVFPVPAITHISVAVVSHTAIMVLFCCALYTYAMLAFGVPLPPSATAFGLSVALLLIGSLTFLSLGLLIGSRTQSAAQALLICHLIYYPFILMSNLLVPDRVLPDWMVAIARVFPLRSLADALRLAIVDHLGAEDLARTVTFLAGWAVACLLLVRPRRLWYATQRDLVRFVIKRARRGLMRLSTGRAPRPVSG
jgi:ABC-2 type transport system permease protein